MPIEIEKKYRLTTRQKAQIVKRLSEGAASFIAEELEENTLYSGPGIDRRNSVLRLRRVHDRALLTFKRRFPTRSSIKHQQEEELVVSDATACDALLQALGYKEALVYEKRRSTWKLGDAEIVIDELPFGEFMEIEATESEIERIESLLNLKRLQAENATYPGLAIKHGKKKGAVIEARFVTTKDKTR